MAPLSLGWEQQLLHSGEKLHEVRQSRLIFILV